MMTRVQPPSRRPTRTGTIRLALLALAAGGALGWLAPVGAQPAIELAQAALRVEPTPDMDVTAVLTGGERLTGILTAISPETVSIRIDGAVRDLPRSQITRLEHDIVLVQRDGQRLTGRFLSRDRDWFTIRVGGVEARIPVDSIERVELQLPLRKRYEQMRSLIDDADVDRLLLVAEWLRSVQLLDEALRELDHILEVDRFNDRARNLRELVSRQIEFRDRRDARGRDRAAPPVRPAPTPPRAAVPEEEEIDDLGGAEVEDDETIEHMERSGRVVPLGQRSDFPLLSPQQVALMKVYELDLSKPTRLVIKRETINKLLERFAGDPLLPATRNERDAFYRKQPAEILDIMFRLQARELYAEVQVVGEVDPMRRFRDSVQTTWLLQNCSTSGCHGDANPSGLTLYRRRMGAEQSVYTNFLILDRYRTSDGEALIDWQTPERSLLMQMGMTRQNAFRPHPEVRGWRPVFRNVTDRRFREAVAWIGSMYRPRSNYEIDYTPPGEASRRPSEAAATDAKDAGR